MDEIMMRLDTSECDELFLIIYKRWHLGLMPSREEIDEHLQSHYDCHERNAWVMEA